METWRPIPGFETLYAVSDAGRIKSLRNGRVMSPGSGMDGYPIVSLYRAGKRHGFALHRLVALAFHADERNALHNEVAHLDGNRANCRADNLKWVSKRENHSHKRLHGTHQAGEKHPRAKLTREQADYIRSRPATSRELAAAFGISRHTVFDIWQGARWKDESAVAASDAPKE